MNKIIKKTLIATLLTALLIAPAIAVFQVSALPPNWNVTGNWFFNVYSTESPGGNPYQKVMQIVQDEYGVITGSGYNLPMGGYEWTVAGTVSGDTIDFILTYTNLPGYVATFTGTITATGVMEGTWYDNLYCDTGTWGETCFVPISLEFPSGSTAVAVVEVIDDENNLPPCIPPLPEGLTPYVQVTIISGGFSGPVSVAINYDGLGLTEEEETMLRLYLGDCVDFNLDGTINGEDLALIKKGIKAGQERSPWDVPFDVNNDGVVDEFDVDIVKAYMSEGIIVNQGNDVLPQARLPWIDITTYVDLDANMIYGETNHFSIFRAR